MTINIINGKAHLDTPYNPEFVARMKAIGARWDAASRTWTVKENMINEAREIMRAVYGHDDTQGFRNGLEYGRGRSITA